MQTNNFWKFSLSLDCLIILDNMLALIRFCGVQVKLQVNLESTSEFIFLKVQISKLKLILDFI